MKFRVDRDPLAEAVTWAARRLSARPTDPVLAGMLMRQLSSPSRALTRGLDPGHLTVVTGRGARSWSRAGCSPRSSRRCRPPGRGGRRGHPRHPRVRRYAFTLDLLPDEEYPTLPAMPTIAGTVSSEPLAPAVGQVAIAAGRDDTLPTLRASGSRSPGAG